MPRVTITKTENISEGVQEIVSAKTYILEDIVTYNSGEKRELLEYDVYRDVYMNKYDRTSRTHLKPKEYLEWVLQNKNKINNEPEIQL
ncbi:MAG: hypothetical protein PHS54_03995 [Clostridia bacterium]|nr:hypothetical protein [Clostridia bacterium]